MTAWSTYFFTLGAWFYYIWVLGSIYSGIAFAFRLWSTESGRIYFMLCRFGTFWNFVEWANKVNVFPVLPLWSKVA